MAEGLPGKKDHLLEKYNYWGLIVGQKLLGSKRSSILAYQLLLSLMVDRLAIRERSNWYDLELGPSAACKDPICQ